jgi:hypothetical protein
VSSKRPARSGSRDDGHPRGDRLHLILNRATTGRPYDVAALETVRALERAAPLAVPAVVLAAVPLPAADASLPRQRRSGIAYGARATELVPRGDGMPSLTRAPSRRFWAADRSVT